MKCPPQHNAFNERKSQKKNKYAVNYGLPFHSFDGNISVEEFLSLWTWWKHKRQAEHATYENLSHEFHGLAKPRETPGWWRRQVEDIMSPVHESLSKRGIWKDPEHQKKLGELMAMEKALQDKDDEMLQRLITIRHYLWT